MLKQIIANGRTIPVPVPLATLHQALEWVCDTLCNSDQSLTRVVINNDEIDLEALNSPAWANHVLGGDTRLEVRMDSPIDLAIQSLEALTNLSSVVERTLRTSAVECWGLAPGQQPKDFDYLYDDLELIADLLGHFSALADPSFGDVQNFWSVGQSFQQSIKSLRMARSQSDWRAVAKMLLNKFEPQIAELMIECVRIESHLIEIKSKQPTTFSLKARTSESKSRRLAK